MQEIKLKSLDALLEYAATKGATDIHITVGTTPMVRVNSSLQPVTGSEKMTQETIKEIVISCIDERKLQVLETMGAVDFSFSKQGLGRYRVNVYKQRGTYAMAIRTQPFIIPQFDSLGLPPIIKSFARLNKGLVLITGVTGSGKSTTLASLIDVINEERQCHIITAEDPIEYLHRHKRSLVNQREIGMDSPSFKVALRSVLREDPDVILVGEMRDAETISIALTAAETGHLVFSTLHTIGAAKVVDRIIDSFPPNQQSQIQNQLATVLEGVVFQQLVPSLNGGGLLPVAEVMVANPAVRNLIREGKSHMLTSVIQTGANLGMQSLESNLAELCLTGKISREDGLSRAQDKQYYQQLLSKRW